MVEKNIKPLDDVIKSIRICFSYNIEDECKDCAYFNHEKEICESEPSLEKDTLYYLNQYKNIIEEKNNALSWEKLIKLEGKPVWFEYDNKGYETLSHTHVWAIIDMIDYSMIFPEIKFISRYGEFWMTKESMGRHWNAYIKENK